MGTTKNFDQLIAGANIIRKNELPESNTHGLVGQQLLDMIKKQAESDSKVEDTKADIDNDMNSLRSEIKSQLQNQNVNFQAAAAVEFEKNKSYVDGKSIEIVPESVKPESLSASVRQMISAGAGTITNLVDDEDLESVDGIIKFRDKKYIPSNFSGLGRKYLRKNINAISGNNILTQEMIRHPNTIYIVQYDYDLAGAIITVPEGCTLQFDGGSLSNGTLNGDDTKIKINDISSNSCEYSGTFKSINNLQIKSIKELEGVRIPIGFTFDVISDGFSGTFTKINTSADGVIWINDDGQKYIYNGGNVLVIDHFGIIKNDLSFIDSNSRIFEKLTQYVIPIQLTKGITYMRNVDMNLYGQRLFSIVGIQNDAYGLSGIGKNDSAICSNGDDLFITFTPNNNGMQGLKIRWVKFRGKNFSGRVISTAIPDTTTDISVTLEHCYFENFDSVIRTNWYGTGLIVKSCVFRNIRTAIWFGYACNLAYLFENSFLGVGQCIRVYGYNTKIIKTEFNTLYTGPDWETLDLFCLWIGYNVEVDQVYMETYGNHDSLYKFKVIKCTNSNLNTIILKNFTFNRYSDNVKGKISHIHFIGVNSSYPYNQAAIRCYGDGITARDTINHYPSFITNENNIDFLPFNITYNDDQIINKYLCSGVGSMPISIPLTSVTTTNKNLTTFSLLFSSSSVNAYDSLIPESFKTNGAIYYNGGYFAGLGKYNISGVLKVTNAPDGLIDLFISSRNPDTAVRSNIQLGTYEIKGGVGYFTFNKIVSLSQWWSLVVGKNSENINYAVINGGSTFESELEIELIPLK